MADKAKRKSASKGEDEALLSSDPIIGGLRKLFDDVVNEPVPDEFLKILQDIDKKSETSRGGGGQ